MVDPLVINLEGDIAGLQDQTFFFDLDADGVEEEISMLGSGSGYLALDKNGDGVLLLLSGNLFPLASLPVLSFVPHRLPCRKTSPGHPLP